MRKTVFLFLALLLLAATGTTAQSQKGTIRGVVVDSSKLKFPGVAITVRRNLEIYKAVTNEKGEYEISVPTGFYSVSAELRGFDFINYLNMEVKSDKPTLVNFEMTIHSDVPNMTQPKGRWIPLSGH
jgi:Carboxypeptidase regulatory-like domain